MTAEQYEQSLQELVENTDSVLATYDESIKGASAKEIKQWLTEKRDSIANDFRTDLDDLHNQFRGITDQDAGVRGEQGPQGE